MYTCMWLLGVDGIRCPVLEQNVRLVLRREKGGRLKVASCLSFFDRRLNLLGVDGTSTN